MSPSAAPGFEHSLGQLQGNRKDPAPVPKVPNEGEETLHTSTSAPCPGAHRSPQGTPWDTLAKAQGWMSRGPVWPYPSRMGLGVSQCHRLGCAGLRCPSCAMKCSSRGKMVGLDAGFALLPPWSSAAALGDTLPCFKHHLRREDAVALQDGYMDATGWTGRHGGMDTQSPNLPSVHPLCLLPVAAFSNSWDPTTSQPFPTERQCPEVPWLRPKEESGRTSRGESRWTYTSQG